MRVLGEEAGRFELPDGATLLVVVNTGLFVAATWWVARIANRVASERALARTMLRETEIERDLRARFVRSLAHDLRTPLASIRAGTDRLTRSSWEDPSNAPVSAVVRRGVDRLDRMIGDLLDVERIRSGESIAIQPEPADAAAIVDDVVRTFRVVHGDRLEARVDHPMRGSWDPHALERILENLVSNAFKYGDPQCVVRLTARDAGKVVSFEVHNEGSPIAACDVPALFEPFQRGVDTRGQKGWGLGLPLVHALCTAFGGRVEVESSATGGTTFRAILPKHRERAPRLDRAE
jgi:signal transduction histidine kinase